MKITAKVVLLFLITFLFGVTVGYFLNDPVSKMLKEAEKAEMRDRGPQEREHREMRMRDYMVNELGLSQDQTEPFFEATRNSRRVMRDIMTQTREESTRKIRAEVDSLNVILTEILSEEQLEKWDKMQQMYRHQRGPGNENGPGPRP
ncbi:MAG TPA: hypothetical protein DCE78_07085 [Bacteroidetes bacterium]|nr:hypothetical protein [Bacteroidota bacterium]